MHNHVVPEAEWDEQRYCPPCDKVTIFIVEKLDGDESAFCAECGWIDEPGNWYDYIEKSDDGGGWD